MMPQPLRFTTRGLTAASSQQRPAEVKPADPGQLGTRPLQEVGLTGSLDLSTVERIHHFNAWLMRASYRLERPGQPRDTPRGSVHVELSDEATVTITACLTCVLDVSQLAQTILRLVAPLLG